MKPAKTFRLAVVDSNPVQYRAPFWRAIHSDERISLKVFYVSKLGLEPAHVPGFGSSWVWDIPLLDGYDYEFLPSIKIPILPGPVGNRCPIGLRQELRRGGFDAVLVLGYLSAPALTGILASWFEGLPVVMRGDSHEQGATVTIRKRLKRLLLPLLLKRLDAFLAIGNWNQQYWLELGVPENKIWAAIHAVDNERFRCRLEEEPKRPAELRAVWGAGPDDVVFLYCAKLSWEKAPEVLLGAYERICTTQNTHLVFVGTGPLEADLKGRAAALKLPRVHWPGFVNQSDLPFYYRAANVFVLPSRFEPWGLVVNEAMACGTPVIVSDVVGSGPDLVVGKGTGLVFERDNVMSLIDAMNQAMNSKVRSEWQSHLGAPLRRANFEQNIDALVGCLAALSQKDRE